MSEETKTISFFEMVKNVHPDWNPEIQNPEIKMEELTRYRDDEKELYKLAVRWGLIEDSSIQKADISYKLNEGKLVKVDQKTEGIVVDVKKNNSDVIVVLYINEQFKTYKRNKEESQDDFFYVTGFADEKTYENIDYKYQSKVRGR